MKKYEVMTNEELAREIHVISGVLAGRKFGEKQEAKTVEDTIEHEGLTLHKVDRKARKGDYVRFSGLDNPFTRNGKLYEVVGDVEKEIPPLHTANEARDELIQQAKVFVEEHTKPNATSFDLSGMHYGVRVVRPEFIVNIKKRTVVVLLKGVHNPVVYAKGIAKCMPGDVFNGWIGKAIALARALEIEVPKEFLNAVQPDEAEVGMLIKRKNNWGEINEYRVVGGTGLLTSIKRLRSHPKEVLSIINDTHAEYGAP